MSITKITRIKETLKNILSQFSAERITSDKGILDIQKAGDNVAVGDTVMLVDDEGVESQVEDGAYVLTDGTILNIADGKITEIVIPEINAPEEAPAEEEKPEEAPAEEEKPVDEPAPTEEAPAEDEKPAEETKEEEVPAEEEKPAEEAPAEEQAPAEEEKPAEDEEVARLRAEIAQKDARIAELEARVAELEAEPAAKPATEEFKAVNKIGKTGDEKLDRLVKFMKG